MARYLQSMANIFNKDTKGNVTALFVVLSTPMIAAVGGAIDFGAAVSMKGKMQNALDAAATAVCTAGTQDPEQVLRDRLAHSIGEFGLDLMDPPENPEQPGTPTGNQAIVLDTGFDPATGALFPKLSTNMPTSMLGIAGIEDIALEVSSGVKCGAKRLELSLMLDVTGSMGGQKLTDMKQAANDVLDIFDSNMQHGATRIALVPFSEAVNVGSYANAVRGSYASGSSWTPGSYKYKFYDKWGNYRKWKIRNCVTERLGAEKFTDAPPSVAPVGRHYKSSSCKPNSAEIVPLSTDKALLSAEIASYQASGGTAGHIGTAWAWYMLSDKWGYLWPNSAPEVPNREELIKATILMTDGEYNEEYYNGVDDDYMSWNKQSPNGSSKTQASALCEAMKDPNGDGVYDDEGSVVVYAVGFGLNPNGSTAQRLKDCATDDTKWFFPYNGEQLRAAFVSIGKQLAAGQAGKAVISH